MEKKILPFPPVRPMDPIYVESILSAKNVNQEIVTAIVSALNAYNQKCNQAVNDLENDLNQIFEAL